MKVKIFYPNSEDKIEFTREELEKLINDIYNEGYEDGRSRSEVITVPTPVYPYNPIIYNTPVPNWRDTQVWCTSDNSIGTTVLERASLTEGDISAARNNI